MASLTSTAGLGRRATLIDPLAPLRGLRVGVHYGTNRYVEEHGRARASVASFEIVAKTDRGLTVGRDEMAARFADLCAAATQQTPTISFIPLTRSRHARDPGDTLQRQGYTHVWDVTLGGQAERFRLVSDAASAEMVASGMWLYGGFDARQPLHLFRSLRELRFTANADPTHSDYLGLHRAGVVTCFRTGRSRGAIRETVTHELFHTLSWGARDSRLIPRALCLTMELDGDDLQSGPLQRDNYATAQLEEQWAQTGMYWARRQNGRGAIYPHRFALVEAALRGVFG
ncbi:MAG: hypothetical protein HY696_01885 [Deltaproteobacteria bacterium]|nr:hypothetical protein [Deltaproteobacteria bacterium]